MLEQEAGATAATHHPDFLESKLQKSKFCVKVSPQNHTKLRREPTTNHTW